MTVSDTAGEGRPCVYVGAVSIPVHSETSLWCPDPRDGLQYLPALYLMLDGFLMLLS